MSFRSPIKRTPSNFYSPDPKRKGFPEIKVDQASPENFKIALSETKMDDIQSENTKASSSIQKSSAAKQRMVPSQYGESPIFQSSSEPVNLENQP